MLNFGGVQVLGWSSKYLRKSEGGPPEALGILTARYSTAVKGLVITGVLQATAVKGRFFQPKKHWGIRFGRRLFKTFLWISEEESQTYIYNIHIYIYICRWNDHMLIVWECHTYDSWRVQFLYPWTTYMFDPMKWGQFWPVTIVDSWWFQRVWRAYLSNGWLNHHLGSWLLV